MNIIYTTTHRVQALAWYSFDALCQLVQSSLYLALATNEKEFGRGKMR